MPAIRNVEPGDLPNVRTVLVATWHATYDRTLGTDYVTKFTDQLHSVDSLAFQLSLPGTVFLLAEERGEVVATSFASAAEDGAVMLHRLYVLPAAQGRGTGRALLEETIARFPSARGVRLTVEPHNGPAICFYERNGFTSLPSADEGGGRSDVRAIVMEKRLE